MSLDSIDNLLHGLDAIQGLNAVGLVCFSCIILGYILRFIKKFPNDGIPVAVILWGGFLMMFLADGKPTPMPERVWVVRNACIGLIIGFIAWMLHYWALSWIEEKLQSIFPQTKETTFFAKTKDGSVTETKQPQQNISNEKQNP